MPAKRPAPADGEANRVKRQRHDTEVTAQVRANREAERARLAQARELRAANRRKGQEQKQQQQEEERRRQELRDHDRKQEEQRQRELAHRDETRTGGQTAQNIAERFENEPLSSTRGNSNLGRGARDDEFSEDDDPLFDQALIAKIAEFERKLATQEERIAKQNTNIKRIANMYRTAPQHIGFAIGVAVGDAGLPANVRDLPAVLPQPVAPVAQGIATPGIEQFANHPDFRQFRGRTYYHTQSQDVRPDGTPHDRVHWSHDDLRVQHPPTTSEMKQLFASMGGKNAGEREGYVIPRGNSTVRFKKAAFIDQAISRPATPHDEEGAIRFGERIYYNVQYQDHEDAKRAGGKLEYRSPTGTAAWMKDPRFKGVTALIYCDDANVDRRTLMRFPVLDMATNTPKSRQASWQIHQDCARAEHDRSRTARQGSRA
jgi:hypothetical protein